MTLYDDIMAATEAMKDAFPKDIVTTVVGKGVADAEKYADALLKAVTDIKTKAEAIEKDMQERKDALTNVLI